MSDDYLSGDARDVAERLRLCGSATLHDLVCVAVNAMRRIDALEKQVASLQAAVNNDRGGTAILVGHFFESMAMLARKNPQVTAECIRAVMDTLKVGGNPPTTAITEQM